MEQYTIETQGLNTYRVYACGREDELDTVAVGMMQNNSITGLLPLQVFHVDNTCSLKFNISSKVTLRQFLAGVVSKDRFLKVIRQIADTMLNMEEYLLDLGQLLLDAEDIYVNVGTLDTEMLYYPVLGTGQPVHLTGFLKEILFSTEFDRNENCDYVVSFINFLNKNKEIDIWELKKMLDDFIQPPNQTEANPVKKAVSGEAPVKAQTVQPMPVVTAPPHTVPVQESQPSVPIQAASVQMQPAAPVQMPVVKVNNVKQAKQPKQPKQAPAPVKPEKKGIFGKKKKEKQPAQVQPAGIEIPGMPSVPSVPAAPSKPKEQEISKPAVSSPITPAGIPAPEPKPIPPLTNFGETTVLQAPAIGETTVLGMEPAGAFVSKPRPALERKKTGETVFIAKECFKLGKEQQYVDYCIKDNTAVSRSHADIMKKGEDYYITDNNSLNHTFVNGIQVQSQNPQLLKDGDLVTLADEEFIYKLL